MLLWKDKNEVTEHLTMIWVYWLDCEGEPISIALRMPE